MKYIRTTAGIYERTKVVRQVCDGKEVAVTRPYKTEFEPIVKSADNIEDLFDEYILENKDHTYQSLLVNANPYDNRLPFYHRFTKDVKNGWLSYCSTYLQRGYRIYGAIIVRGTHGEPILKPVAVMNNKDGWDLLYSPECLTKEEYDILKEVLS